MYTEFNEYHKYFDAWKSSDIYLRLKAELEQKKQAIIELKLRLEDIMNEKKHTVLTQDALKKIIEKPYIAFIDWYDINQDTRRELFFDFSRHLINLYYYLKKAVDEENYEFASFIRDIVTRDILRFRTEYLPILPDYNEKYDNDLTDFMFNKARDLFKV